MLEINRNDRNMLIRSMADVSVCAERESDLLKVSAKVFADSFEETLLSDGEEMAQRLLRTVREFDAERFTDGKSLRDTAKSCLDSLGDGTDKKELLRILSHSVKAEELENFVGEGKEDADLLCKISECFSDSLSSQHELASTNENAWWLYDKDELRVLYATALYCAAKKDELSAVPNTVTPEMCAAAVCAGCEADSLRDEKNISSKVILHLLFTTANVIGTALLFVFCFAAIRCCKKLSENSEFLKTLLTPMIEEEYEEPGDTEEIEQIKQKPEYESEYAEEYS